MNNEGFISSITCIWCYWPRLLAQIIDSWFNQAVEI